MDVYQQAYMDRVNDECTMVMEGAIEVKVARMFFDDHVSRGLFTGRIEAINKRTVTITVDYWAFTELLDDARYYVSEARYYDMAAECASAKRIVVVLEKLIDAGKRPSRWECQQRV